MQDQLNQVYDKLRKEHTECLSKIDTQNATIHQLYSDNSILVSKLKMYGDTTIDIKSSSDTVTLVDSSSDTVTVVDSSSDTVRSNDVS